MSLIVRAATMETPTTPSRRWTALVVVVFVVAFGIRVPQLASAPDSFHTMRQYHGQLLARWLHDDMSGDTTDAPQPAAPRVDLDDTLVLEAPVLPAASALGFAATGGESWWIPRSINIAAWLLGGWMLMRLCIELTGSRRAALVAAVCFLFAPFGISLSRSIQPDSLMIVATIGAWWAATVAARAPDRTRHRSSGLVAVGVATACAVLVKAVAGILIVPVVVALLVGRHGWSQLWRHRLLRVTVVAAALPLVLYYGTSIALGAPLRGQFGTSVVPSMLVDPAFWTSWLGMVLSVFGVLGLCALVATVTMYSTGTFRRFLVGASVGFVAMGLLFSYRSATHDYYAAPLLAVVALAVGSMTERLRDELERRGVHPAAALTAVAVVLVVTVATMGGAPSRRPVITETHRRAIETATAALPRGERVLFVDEHYGNQLRHDTGLVGATWPLQIDLDLAELSGSELPGVSSSDPATRLDQLRGEGVRHLVTTIEPSEPAVVGDPFVRALWEQVEPCRRITRDRGVTVIDLDDCG